MENVKIILDNGVESYVNGLFYIFNSKYYFIYTTGEIDDNEYVRLYVVQVGKEIKNTSTGPVDTGYMVGMEISNLDEWNSVQGAITKIVEYKKTGNQSSEIQYLPIDMLVNLKIVGKNKFKLMKHIVENDFKVILPTQQKVDLSDNNNYNLNHDIVDNNEINITSTFDDTSIDNEISVSNNDNEDSIKNVDTNSEIIIDYRTRFFEEQEKNQELQEQIRILNEKLENIKNIIG